MKTILAILTLTLFLTPALAQQKTPPPPGPARPLNLPKITEKKLANGLTVILAPLPNVPKVSSILTFRSATAAATRSLPLFAVVVGAATCCVGAGRALKPDSARAAVDISGAALVFAGRIGSTPRLRS